MIVLMIIGNGELFRWISTGLSKFSFDLSIVMLNCPSNKDRRPVQM